MIPALINRRRRQILIHSYIYYKLGTSIIADHKWDKWARDLVDLQKTYPKIAKSLPYHDVLKDFDGSSGFYLPADEWTVNKALQLLRIHDHVQKEINDMLG